MSTKTNTHSYLHLFKSKLFAAEKLYKDNGVKAIPYIFYYSLKRWFLSYPITLYFLRVRGKRTFLYLGKRLNYFYHSYNMTWNNSRSIEIPIALMHLRKQKGRILEIGNVLKHYFPLKHEVIDKYEKSKGVTNIDVVNLNANNRYDLIISISTLEHIGLDEDKKDKTKVLRVIKKIKNALKNKGEMVVTIPFRHNEVLDTNRNKMFDEVIYYRNRKMDWVEIKEKDLQRYDTAPRFGVPYKFIYIGKYKKTRK